MGIPIYHPRLDRGYISLYFLVVVVVVVVGGVAAVGSGAGI